MNDRTDAELRDDIFQYAGDALEMLGNVAYADFLNDRTLRSAIFYMVGVIWRSGPQNIRAWPPSLSRRTLGTLSAPAEHTNPRIPLRKT